jgi:hypothetical protein
MPDPTNAERSRRFRARRAGKIPPAERLICSACGAGRSERYGEICRRCWERLTPEGRAAKAERVAKARGKHADNDPFALLSEAEARAQIKANAKKWRDGL